MDNEKRAHPVVNYLVSAVVVVASGSTTYTARDAAHEFKELRESVDLLARDNVLVKWRLSQLEGGKGHGG